MLEGAPPVEVVLDDVEALNRAASAGRYALTKLSYAAIPRVLGHYRILRSGGALGRGCGPLVVARPGASADGGLRGLSRTARIAIPGEATTAYLLLRLALGYTPVTEIMRFDAIVAAVASGDVDAGLIIHESRFTYRAAGLVAAQDLGAWWEQKTGLPIPLGAIVARRDLPTAAAQNARDTIRESLAFARLHGEAIAPYVRAHASEMEDVVMQAHIALYVNEYTDDIGAEGVAAVDELFRRAKSAGLVPAGTRPEFV